MNTRWLLLFIALSSLLVPRHSSVVFAQAAPPQSAELTGRTISLDLKGVDILDVLKLLSQQSGLNFVAGRNVSGRVTIFAKAIDVWEAFERIVEANELAYERRGDVVSVMTAQDYALLYGQKFQERTQNVVVPLRYAKAGQLAAVMNQLKSTLGRIVVDEPSNTLIFSDTPASLQAMQQVVTQLDRPTETRIWRLNYADAEKLKEKVQELLSPGVGTFSFDARTNTLVVTDLQDVIGRLDAIIQAFDAQDGEVLIEAKIVKVSLTDEQSLGIDWQHVLADIDTQLRGNFDVLSGDVIGGTATGAALKFVRSPTAETQVVVEALKKVGKVETMSNPRITVSNNQEARILVGTKEAFVTTTTTIPGAGGQVVSSPQVQFVDVGTKLYVTPSIKPDGHVKLKVRPEVSSVASTITSVTNTVIPIVSTTEAETDVLVKSGTMLIIGGLIDTKTERTQSQIPLLGDIPVLGAAFRSRLDTVKKTELVVFLTPQIITPTGEPIREFPAPSNRPASGLGPHPFREQQPPEASDVSIPASYQQQIWRLLAERLRQELPPGHQTGSFDVTLTLTRDGRLVGPPQITSPQGETVGRAIAMALAVAAFPPFPEEVTVPQAQFHFTIEYHP